jgi:multiple sugar transport system ATP-binding protein
MNLVEATIEADAVAFGGFRFPLDRARRPAPAHGRVVLGIRPEAFSAAATPGLPTLQVTPVVVEELGADAHVLFPVDARKAAPDAAFADGEASLLAQEQALIGARIDPGANVTVGGPLTLTVDPARFHFFDPETGLSLLSRGAGSVDSGPVPRELTPA